MALEKGSIVYSKNPTMTILTPGVRGVCHNVYELDGRRMCGVIFENGLYDSYTPFEVERDLTDTGKICDVAARYEFSDAPTLREDFDSGRFDRALHTKQTASQTPPKSTSHLRLVP